MDPTAELQKVNKELENQILENLELKKALENSEKERYKASSELIVAQENERKRMAFELHDVLGKSLTAIKFCVENIIFTKKILGKNTRHQLENIVTMVQDTITETREITKNLWPPVLDDLGIVSTISWYAREFENIYPWIFVDLKISITEDEISDFIKIVIFRILQESMNNCVKHSECKNILICLENDSQGIKLVVEDDGKGFELRKNSSQAINSQGLGLSSMKERARLSDAIFELNSKKGSGTIIKVVWPLKS